MFSNHDNDGSTSALDLRNFPRNIGNGSLDPQGGYGQLTYVAMEIPRPLNVVLTVSVVLGLFML